MLSTIKKIGFKCTCYKLFSRLFPKDSSVLSACDRIGAYRYLEKYKYVLDKLKVDYSIVDPKPDIIWLCWLQGYENAPLIVQKCKESVLKHNMKYKIVVIDNTNVDDYISIPLHIKTKHDQGIIPHAHYSDFIRVSLLAKYGGTWIDSTIFMSDSLPNYVTNPDLFFFQTDYVGNTYGGCCLLSACPNNPIVIQEKELLSEYWSRENRLVSYSIFHLFWAMIINYNKENRLCWESIPFVPSAIIELIQKDMFKPFSQERFDQITAITPIHKLTYKFSPELTQLDNTFYKHLVR